MEARSVTPSRLSPGPPPGPVEHAAAGLWDPVRDVIEAAGDFAAFSGRAVIEVARVWRYTGEVLRQAGILILGSALVIWGMVFIIGLECATESDYILRGYGASGYTGVFTAWCGLREYGPYMFGYIMSAKVGCGLVAELGSMRIQDEFDGMESMGLDPMRYVVATRLLAAWLVLPPIFIVGIGLNYLGDWLVVIVQIGEVSQGAWETIHWLFQSPADFLYSFLKVWVMFTTIVLVGMYFGYNARGGPAGVGRATARSMIVNLILVHVIGAVGSSLFWGLSPNAPIGG
jgi:phospholipid/cholesterol/gamma-HCH transport system permease protein